MIRAVIIIIIIIVVIIISAFYYYMAFLDLTAGVIMHIASHVLSTR